MKRKHEQKPYTVFGSVKTIRIIWSATIRGALIRFIKQTGENVDAVLPGAMIN